MSVALRAVAKRMARRRPAIRISCTGCTAPSMYPMRRIARRSRSDATSNRPLLVRLSSVGADDAHAVDPFDHPVRQLGVDRVTVSPSSRAPFVNSRTMPETSSIPSATTSVSRHDIRSSSATYTTTVLVVMNRCTRIFSASLVRQVSDARTFSRRPERSRSIAAEAHGQQLTEDAAAEVMRDARPSTHVNRMPCEVGEGVAVARTTANRQSAMTA